MAKVSPEGEKLFEKPIKFKFEEDLKAFDATYLKRKEAVGEKFFTCTSNRKFCYFTDGADPAKEGVAVVLCMHGAGCRKCTWLFKEPPKDIFQIAVDRIGLGASSSAPATGYSFEMGCKDLTELIDHVYGEFKIPKEKKFFVTGHSMGGTWALSMAACPEVRDRIEAIAPISAPCDVWNPRMTAEDRKRLKHPVPPPCLGSAKKGCGGSFNRWLIKNVIAKFSMRSSKFGPEKTGVDYGCASHWAMMMKGGNEIIGDPEKGFRAMEKDPFFVTGHVDGFRSFRTPQDMLVEMQRCYGNPWSYDMSGVKCPCFMYNGKYEEIGEEYAKANQRLIGDSNSEVHLIMWDGHGHLSIGVEYTRIIEGLVKKTKVEKPIWEA